MTQTACAHMPKQWSHTSSNCSTHVSDKQAAFSRAITLDSEFLSKGSPLPLPIPRNLRLLNAPLDIEPLITLRPKGTATLRVESRWVF